MRLSVVIPSYNHEAYIAQAIGSVFAQASDAFELELVIVDDGSSDSSVAVIKDCLNDSPLDRCVLLEQENRGAHAAIMRGLEQSQGNLLTILNSDDAFLPGRFEAIVSADTLDTPTGSDSDYRLVYTLIQMIDEHGVPLAPMRPENLWYQNALALSLACPTRGFGLLRENPVVTSGNMVFSRALYERLGGFSTHRLSHDWDFLIRSTYYTEPVFIPEVLMQYRIHPQNTTHTVRHLMEREGRDGLHRFLSLQQQGPSPNPIAPLPGNWPRYWPWFTGAIAPHFNDRPILESIEPDALSKRLWTGFLGRRDFDPYAASPLPRRHESLSDPILREHMLVMSRTTPTTDGMDVSMQPLQRPRSKAGSIRERIKRALPGPLKRTIKKMMGLESPIAAPPPPKKDAPSVDPDQIEIDPDRPLVIVVTHEASRSGAPLLACDLVRRLVHDHDAQCLTIIGAPGPLTEEFARHGWVVDGRRLPPWGEPSPYGVALMEKLAGATNRYALCNTASSWPYARFLQQFGYRTISLVHDFATNYPADDFRQVVSHSDRVIYPCEAVRQVALTWADLPTDHGIVRPQGLLRESFLTADAAPARAALRRRLGLPEDAIIALGCGPMELRKGPELFQLVALETLRRCSQDRLHFVWVGGGTDTCFDPVFWCQRDAKRCGMEDRMHFIGDVDDTTEAFLGSDLYMLTSREDPFPCVVHEAMACGLPVVSFESSGGASIMLADGGGVVVPFGDIEGMADIVLWWVIGDEDRIEAGAAGRHSVATHYRMSTYVAGLHNMGLQR
jgi:glycosyltransferase involved in cell wall biosynthesis